MLTLPEEDAATIEHQACIDSSNQGKQIEIVVVHFPQIANFDNFDPLNVESSVRLRFVQTPDEIGCPDVLILPGTKNTLSDLQWLEETGIADIVKCLSRREVSIVGICGGYQMLGRQIHNPHRLESKSESIQSLNLLDVETTFKVEKMTTQVQAVITDDSIAPGTLGETLTGYEIHIGHTETSTAWLSHKTCETNSSNDQEPNHLDGAQSEDGRIWGCYLHGLFHNDLFRRYWLATFGLVTPDSSQPSSHEAAVQSLERLADVFETHVDLDNLWTKLQQKDQETHHAG